MKMKTITTSTNIYLFEELSDDAQQNALDKHREWLVNDPYWYTCIEEDWNDKLSNLGIENPKISWVFGFSCRTFLCTLYSKVGLVCGSSMFFKPVHSFQKSDQRVDCLSILLGSFL
jgi:hypothetical protein